MPGRAGESPLQDEASQALASVEPGSESPPQEWDEASQALASAALHEALQEQALQLRVWELRRARAWALQEQSLQGAS
jgi:hypothetical protein